MNSSWPWAAASAEHWPPGLPATEIMNRTLFTEPLAPILHSTNAVVSSLKAVIPNTFNESQTLCCGPRRHEDFWASETDYSVGMGGCGGGQG